MYDIVLNFGGIEIPVPLSNNSTRGGEKDIEGFKLLKEYEYEAPFRL